MRAVQRPLLDLPLEDGRSLLWHWRNHVIDLRQSIGLDNLEIRLLIDRHSPLPVLPPRASRVVIRVDRDLFQYRGTGGVLRDLADDFADDDYILVASAAQALLWPLPELAAQLAARGGDACLAWNDDGTPSGMMLFRCAILRQIPAGGYVDLKEQALPLLATQFNIRHLPQVTPTALPIRTLEQYITAMQCRYRQRLGRTAPAHPFEEDCRPTFAVVEEGACISAEARIHDARDPGRRLRGIQRLGGSFHRLPRRGGRGRPACHRRIGHGGGVGARVNHAGGREFYASPPFRWPAPFRASQFSPSCRARHVVERSLTADAGATIISHEPMILQMLDANG